MTDNTQASTTEAQAAASNELLPVPLPVGAIRSLVLSNGEEVLLIGSAPSGLPVIISPADWQFLLRWKLTKLHTVSGQVRACGGGNVRPLAARFLTNTMYAPNYIIRYRNGNALDLRRSNIAVVPRGVILEAKRIAATPPPTSNTVTLRDGRVRTRRKPKNPNAIERLREIMTGGER